MAAAQVLLMLMQPDTATKSVSERTDHIWILTLYMDRYRIMGMDDLEG